MDSIEYPSVRVTIPSGNEINTQVTPGEVSIQLRPGLVILDSSLMIPNWK